MYARGENDKYNVDTQKIQVEQNLEAMRNILTPTSITKSHTLDTTAYYWGEQVSIYNHLSIYQNKFAENFAGTSDFAEKMKLLDDRMSKIKIDDRPATTGSDVKDRSIVSGNDNWSDDDKWASDVTYVRNKWYNCTKERGIEICSIIADLWTEFGLNLSESIQLFVLRMWLGKCGWQDFDGRFYNVGESGSFAIGPVDCNGNVPHIYFNDVDSWFGSDWQKDAIPQLSN